MYNTQAIHVQGIELEGWVNDRGYVLNLPLTNLKHIPTPPLRTYGCYKHTHACNEEEEEETEREREESFFGGLLHVGSLSLSPQQS